MSTVSTLYVYRDHRGAVLYVGITDRGIQRSTEHHQQAAWWDLAASATFEHFQDRAAAVDAEAEAIRRFRPYFNAQHNVGYRVTRDEWDQVVATLPTASEPFVQAPDVVCVGVAVGNIAELAVGHLSKLEGFSLANLVEQDPTRIGCVAGSISGSSLTLQMNQDIGPRERRCVLSAQRTRNGKLSKFRLVV